MATTPPLVLDQHLSQSSHGTSGASATPSSTESTPVASPPADRIAQTAGDTATATKTSSETTNAPGTSWNPGAIFVALIAHLMGTDAAHNANDGAPDTATFNPLAQLAWAWLRSRVEDDTTTTATPAAIVAEAPPLTTESSAPTTTVASSLAARESSSSPAPEVSAAAKPAGTAAGTLDLVQEAALGSTTASAIAVNKTGTIAYVQTAVLDPLTNTTRQYVQRVDPATGQTIGTPVLIPAPSSIILAPADDRLYAVGANTITTVNTTTDQIIGSPIVLPGQAAIGGRIAISGDGNTLYVPLSYDDGGRVIAVNTSTGETASLKGVTGATSVIYDAQRNRVYALLISGPSEYASVLAIDTSTGPIARIPVPSSYIQNGEDILLSKDGSKIYVLLRTSVVEIDTATLAADATFPFDLSSNSEHSIAVSPDGKHLAVSGVTASGVTVVEIDLATGSVTGGVKGIDFLPAALIYSPDSKALYTVGYDGATVGADGKGGIFGRFTTDTGSGSTGGPGTVVVPPNPLDLLNFFSDIASYARVAVPFLAPFAAPLSGVSLALGAANLFAGTVNNNPYQQIGGALQLVGGIVGVVSLFAAGTPLGVPLFGLALALDLTGALVSGIEQSQNAAIAT